MLTYADAAGPAEGSDAGDSTNETRGGHERYVHSICMCVCVHQRNTGATSGTSTVFVCVCVHQRNTGATSGTSTVFVCVCVHQRNTGATSGVSVIVASALTTALTQHGGGTSVTTSRFQALLEVYIDS
jgi:hypothetical protein